MRIFFIPTFCFQALCTILFLSIPTKNIFSDCTTQTYTSKFPIGGELSIGVDDFRSLPEGSYEGNIGAFLSLNLKAPLPKSFFIEAGGSYGLYDFAGRTSTSFKNTNSFQQQGFITGSVSRETPCSSGINVGVAYDWMFNKNFGVFAVDPSISQVRGQLGYLIKGGNELGILGTIDTNTSHQKYESLPLKFRAISQANLFWCHYFKNNAYGMLWAGTPYRQGLMYSSGRAGRYIIGGRFWAPLTRSLSMNGHFAYMGAQSASNGIESKNYAANVSFALTYAFGHHKLKQTPYMGLADNSNFLVDTNLNQ